MKKQLLFLFALALFLIGNIANAQYCVSNFSNVTYEHITNVTFAGINNSSAGNVGGPVDYTAQVANVTAGSSYSMSVTILPDAQEYVFAFIDWNKNGVLNDPGEVYTIASSVNTAGPHTASISVPPTALPGNTRMRVMLVYANATPDPCINSFYGEAEDYTVNVSGSGSPYLAVVPGSINFGYVPFGSSSASQQYALSGDYLDGTAITVTAPASFEVSLDNTTWSSSLNVTYTAPTLASTTVYVRFTPGAANTSYSGNVSNAGGGATTVNVAVSGTSQLQYCAAGPTSAVDSDLFRVQVNGPGTTFDHNVGCTGILGVQDFTALTGLNLQQGEQYSMTLTMGQCGVGAYTNVAKAWIDYNLNGVFDDPAELLGVVQGATSSTGIDYTLNFVVPTGISLGNTRLRVMQYETTDPNSVTPCAIYSWGSVHEYIVDITPQGTCPSPTALTATNLTPNTADLSWTENGTATLWDIEFGISGFTPTGIPTYTGVTNPYGVSGLLSATTYQYYVRADCGGGDYSSWIGPYAFTTLISCPAPTNLSATNVMQTTADLSWTENGTATSWDIELGITGFTPTGTPTYSGVTNPYSVSGLLAATTYQYYVRADCGGGDYSSWVGPYTFQTACAVFTAPFNEPFTATTIPNCWTMSGPQNWVFYTGWPDYGALGLQDHTPGGGTNYAGVDGSGSVSLTGITLTSPFIDVTPLTTPRLRFYLFNNNINDASYQTLRIDLFDGTNWNNSVFFWGPTDNASSWQEIIIPLGGYPITGPVQFRFVVDKSSGLPFYDDIIIDDVIVEETPICPYPSALMASNITDVSADLSWTENGTATSWDIELGLSGFTPTGTPTHPAVTNPYAMTGLTSGTAYQFYVRADCGGGDYSPWTGPYAFSTLLCDPVDQCDYTFNLFDSYGDGWNGATMQIIQNGVVVATIGTGFITGTTFTTTVALCDTYGIEVFWNNGGGYPTECGLEILDAFNNQLYYQQVLDALLVGTTLYTGTVNCTPPTCPDPTNLSATGMTLYTANLSWTPGGTETLWNVEVGLQGFTPGTSTAAFWDYGWIATTHQAFGLAPGTTYELYVQADCGGGDLSGWAGPYTFSTACDVISAFPYTEDFSGGVVPPVCWSADITNPNYTWNYNPAFPGVANIEYDPALVPQDEWLISPVFDFTALTNPALAFDWQMSYYWAIDPFDNYDLICHISTDGGNSWTQLWEEADEGVFTGFTVYTDTLDLSTYAGQSNVMLAWQYIGTDGAQATIDNVTVFDDVPPMKSLTVTAYLEGLYESGTGTMRKAQDVDLITWMYVDKFGGDTADVVTLELITTTGGVAFTQEVGLSTTGTINVDIVPSYGDSYYIYIRHRNSIAISSANPVSFAGSTITYNFSTAAAQAYFDNQKNLGSGVFGLFAGDVDQDGSVGAFDLILVDNASKTFMEGYYPEDVNGDAEVGAFDLIFVDNNSRDFVFEYLPF
jgi:hypothetical protein